MDSRPLLKAWDEGVPTMNGRIANVRRFLIAEDGPTAVEYAVMLLVITPVLVALVKSLGDVVTGVLSSVNSTISP